MWCVGISSGSISDPVHSCETEKKSNPASAVDLTSVSAMATEAQNSGLCSASAFPELKLQKDRLIN